MSCTASHVIEKPQKHAQIPLLKISGYPFVICLALLLFTHVFIFQVRFKDGEDATKEIAALIQGKYKDQSGTCERPCY